jgi:hypothetical protein
VLRRNATGEIDAEMKPKSHINPITDWGAAELLMMRRAGSFMTRSQLIWSSAANIVDTSIY